MPKPLLSIGIIFKNEIRCLERCLSSLAPLREAVPCELVVADTGSDDGSREVAEKYADVVFDFPWINDFAAARTAVKELSSFLRSNNRKDLDVCTVVVRNYGEIDNFDDYNDFLTIRILRMSTGIRYEGAVHEMWRGPDDGFVNKTLSHTILHHDGYVGLNEDAGKAKRQRNQALLEELLKEDPDNVRTLLQYIESSRPDPQHLDYVRRGLARRSFVMPCWPPGAKIFKRRRKSGPHGGLNCSRIPSIPESISPFWPSSAAGRTSSIRNASPGARCTWPPLRTTTQAGGTRWPCG